MNVYRLGPPPKWWEPKLWPWLVRMTAGYRRRVGRKRHNLISIDVHNEDVVRQAIDDNCGVLIAPNHSSHADPHAIYDAADRIKLPLFVMATWHVFVAQNSFGQWMLQRHGCFSVDRDGADMKAFKEAMRLLQEEPFPLVIFPEGEIYHCNDRITPFLEGPATIAITAARRGQRKVVAIPCAMKYRYLDDPMEELLKTMDELERQVLWRPTPDQTLVERIYKFSEAILSLKEMEYMGAAGQGSLTDRVTALAEFILARHESTREIDPGSNTIPERVKDIRRRCIKELMTEDDPPGEDELKQLFIQLDDAFLVGQLFSYPGDYVKDQPSIERLAETIDKFEEDVLQRETATIRGARHCDIYFGDPITVSGDKKNKVSPSELTVQLEQGVQSLLDQA